MANDIQNMNTIGKVMSGIHAEGYACGTLHVLSYLFLLILASFVPEAEVGMVARNTG